MAAKTIAAHSSSGRSQERWGAIHAWQPRRPGRATGRFGGYHRAAARRWPGRRVQQPALLWGIAFELAFTAAVIYLPPLQSVFGTASLGARRAAVRRAVPVHRVGRGRAAPLGAPAASGAMTTPFAISRWPRLRVRDDERPPRRVERDRDARGHARGTPRQAIVLAVGLQPARAVAGRRGGRRHDRRHRHGRRRGRDRGHRRRARGGGGAGTCSPGGSAFRRARATRSSAGSSAPRWSRAALTPSTGAGSTAGIRSAWSARSIALAISPLLGALAALLAIRALRRLARRGTRRWHAPVHGGEWAMSAALAFSHGANDAQKSIGVIAALLLADGRLDDARARRCGRRSPAPSRSRAGTALGGWRIVRTVGPRHLPDPAGRRARQPGRVGRRDPRGVAGRGAGVHHPGRRVVGRRRRRRPAPLAPRALGDGRRHGPRVGGHDPRRPRRSAALILWRWMASHEPPPLVPPADPDVLGLLAARPRSRSRAWRRSPLGRRRRGGRAHGARLRAPGRRGQARAPDALRAAFVTPLEPEDLFALSRGIDESSTTPRTRSGVRGDGVPAERRVRRDGGLPRRGDAQARGGHRHLGRDGDLASRRPTPRSSASATSSTSTASRWPRCSRSTTCAR